MKRSGNVVSIAIAVAIGAAVITFIAGRRTASTPLPTPKVTAQAEASRHFVVPAATPTDRGASAPDVKEHAQTHRAVDRDYAKELRGSHNYKTFISAALEQAKKGDADAAYYLYAAIAYCDETNRFFFKRGTRTLSVDEAITDRERLPGPSMTAAIRIADDRCHDVNNTDDPIWGTGAPWLAQAAAAGQPMAEMKMAEKALIALATSGSTAVLKPDGSGNSFTVSDARSLVRSALESNNPEVIFEMGGMLGLMKSKQLDQDNTIQDTLTWEYAACLRGMDCSSSADWLMNTCLSDPTCRSNESGTDYLERTARQASFMDLEGRAKALNENLDAQAWDEIGLDRQNANDQPPR